MILLYSDSGVGPYLRSLIEKECKRRNHLVTLCTSDTLLNTDWEHTTKLLIMPGGRDIPYMQKLAGKGNERIHSFVTNGGSYLGICAGAYYGAQRICFDKGQPLQVCQERELAFFPCLAKGPAFGPGTFAYNSEKGSRAALIEYSSKTLSVQTRIFYNGGCYFVGAENHKNVEVLARYKELADTPAAIVCCSVGKGKAVLSGLHFEQGSNDLLANNPFHNMLLPALTEAESDRNKLFDDILLHLLRYQ